MARKASQITWRASSVESKYGVKEKINLMEEASNSGPFTPLFLVCIPKGASPIIGQKLQKKYKAVEIFFDYPFYAGREKTLEKYKAKFWLIVPKGHPYFSQSVSPYIPLLLDNTFKYINLDTSSMLAIVSDLTNGKAKKIQNQMYVFTVRF